MNRKRTRDRSIAMGIVLTGTILAFWAAPAVAYPGGCHNWAAEAAAKVYGSWRDHAVDSTDIDRDRPMGLLPELGAAGWWYNPKEGCCDEDDRLFMVNWDWLRWAAEDMDDYDDQTRHHFWHPEWGLHHDVNNPGMNNAWEEVHQYWTRAIAAWNEGNLSEAYTNLGYCLHFIQDGGQPAHANEDMHPGDALSDDDSLEDWITGDYCHDYFDWDLDRPDRWRFIPTPPHDNAGLLGQILTANGGCWDPGCDYAIEPDSGWEEQDEYLFNLAYPYSVYNKQQFFFVMYWVNQMGNYFASDSENGDVWEIFGWLEGYSRIPYLVLHCPTTCENGWTWPQDRDGLNPDNDGQDGTADSDNDDDGDLSTIAEHAYGASMSGSVALIDLFRRTVDAVPPVSIVTKTRADGLPYREWNNSPVRVEITGATDAGNPYLRASEVWMRWGLADGLPPSIMDNADRTPYWLIAGDGIHPVQLLTTDWIGNVETEDGDFVVRVDQTPPEIDFPTLRPNYLTSQTFTAVWTATDATSGVASEVAYLDGQVIDKGQIFDLAQMVGRHSLRVIVYDLADNFRDVVYEFEVWIDADGWCLPVNLNAKTRGEGMTCVVEFPAYYDIGTVELDSTRFAVKGWVDLHEGFPVLGETARLSGVLLTGVGDHDEDGIPDRKIKFDKAEFADALFGETGEVGSVIYGGLLPDGERRYLAPVVVPVF